MSRSEPVNQSEQIANVVIVGGSSGLGKELALMYIKLGHQVVILSRNCPGFIEDYENMIHISVDLLTCTPNVANILVSKVFEKIGKINYLIFCQRYRGEDKTLINELSVSLTATEVLIDEFLPIFSDDSDKSVAVVSSVYGDYVGSSQPIDYHVVKAGLNALVRYYAVKLGAQGIRINAISPLTYLKEESKQFYLSDEKKMAKYEKLVPLQRMGTAAECASVVYFLCSRLSSFVNGQNIYVDGGVSVIWPEELV
ncbi:SDR family oxidoreductase [Methylomonas sp. YC3]